MNKDSMQELVQKAIENYNLKTLPEINYIDLTSEIGEIGKELLKGNEYGSKQFVKTENLELEIGDAFFSLICLANTLDINIYDALTSVIKKYDNRFKKKGHIGSEEI